MPPADSALGLNRAQQWPTIQCIAHSTRLRRNSRRRLLLGMALRLRLRLWLRLSTDRFGRFALTWTDLIEAMCTSPDCSIEALTSFEKTSAATCTTRPSSA